MTEARGDRSPSGTEYALPLVVRIERADPPQRTDALEAAARVVLRALAEDDPDWVAAIAAWDGGRIRKVVRRARGADWRRTEALRCLEVSAGSAQVRVFAPVPVTAWPPELARLQVGGTELEDAQPPGLPPAGVPVVLLAPGVAMTAGKAMAQAGHAAQLGWRALDADARRRWVGAGLPVAVRTAGRGQWADAVRAGAPVVSDGGFTEVEPGTETATIVGLGSEQ